MQASQRGLRWAACLDLLEEMAARRVPVDLQAQTAALAGSWRRALTSARRHSLEPDSAWSVMVLKALEPRSWHRAFHQLQADAQRGLKKDARQLSAAAGAWPRSLEFLDRPGANIVVYNAVSAGSPWRSALLSLTSALHVALRLDALGYCSAVAAAKAAGRWAWALWLFWDLPKRRLQSDEVLLTAAVQACPDWQVAVLLLDSARRARMRPAVSLSLQVCTSAANASEWRFALRRLARLGPAAHVTAAVRCALQGRAWSWALHLTAGRAARGREGFADVCAMAMTALEKTSRWQRQQKLFEDVRLWRCELDAVCVTVGLSSFRPWQWPSALHLTERCSDDNQDKQRRSVVLEACGADNWRLGVELALRKVEPDLVLFSQASASCEQGSVGLRRAAISLMRVEDLEPEEGYYHLVSTAALVAMAGHELCGLVATYLGTQHTQALVPHLKSRCLPSFLLALMFGVLATAERLFSRSDWTVAHVMPSADSLTEEGRPVYTMQYFEWGINVPILFILSGYCSLGRPLHEVSRPLIVTNIYVIFCWAATATDVGLLKWMLIAVSFAMFGWASVDMIAWTRNFDRTAPQDLPSRQVRPWLSNGLILHFLLYGVVYMASVTGLIEAQTERKGFFVLTFGAKIAYCAAFVFIRADEYHKTLTDVLRKVSVSNVGMISILRGSFDIILPCVLDAGGRCKLPPQLSGDMQKLEKILGCRVAGANLKDLLATEEDKTDFSAYVRNVLRQADSPQAFSEASLSTTGQWAGAMPPIAQVLHSKMLASASKMHATLHLSVVPRSALSHGRERHLVAAIQFTTPEETKEAEGGFESFKLEEVQASSAGGTTKPGSSVTSAIVANLADLNKLGASAILHQSDAASEETGSNYWGPTMVTDDTMSHLGAFAKTEERGVGNVAFDARIVGVWEGTTSKALGGYAQRIEFHNDCLHASITVMGQTLEARFRMDCSCEPAKLDIEVLPQGSSCPPPAIPYIFKFQGAALVLCGPSDGRMQRPQSFDGPGLCVMNFSTPRTERHIFEPDPEFSRVSTEARLESGAFPQLQFQGWYYKEPKS
ncbi:unnamed protein product [Effrenium voratum]|nr:unnamed protein product [Effrenium voratum]